LKGIARGSNMGKSPQVDIRTITLAFMQVAALLPTVYLLVSAMREIIWVVRPRREPWEEWLYGR